MINSLIHNNPSSAADVAAAVAAEAVIARASEAATIYTILTNANAGAIVIGTPVYASAAGSVNKARANAAATSVVVGLVTDTTVATTGAATIRTAGPLVATTTQWDAVTGQSGGLTFGASYYVDPATAGKLTSTIPTTVTQFVAQVGVAVSTTTLVVEVRAVWAAPLNPSIVISGTPDGVVTGFAGQMATDVVTGVRWQNANGLTKWYPIFAPRTWGTDFFDDFITANASSNLAIGAGTNVSAGEQGMPGITTQSVAVAGVDAAVVLSVNSTRLVHGGGAIWIRGGIRIAALSNATDNLVFRFGSGDASTFADHVDGCYFEYDFATHGDHNLRLCTSNNSVRTKTTTGIAMTASAAALTNLEIMVNAAGTSVTGLINGVAVPTPVTTNIPITAARASFACHWMVQKQLGAGAMTAAIDWYEFKQVFTTAR